MDLSAYTVLEIGEYVSAPYSGHLLAALGADVVKVEPPEGDVARRVGPYGDDEPDLEGSAFFGYLNAGKRSITLDLEAAHAVDVLTDLVETLSVDLVVENRLAACGIDPQTLIEAREDLVVVSVTGFGTDGPWQEYESPEIVLAAESGQMNKTGYPDRPPTRVRIKSLDYMGGIFGALGGVAALYDRDSRGGSGQHVDVSSREAGTTSMEYFVAGYSWCGETSQRRGNAYADQGPQTMRPSVIPAADGYVAASVPVRSGFEAFVTEMLDEPELLEDERFSTLEARLEHDTEVFDLFRDYAGEHGKWELFEDLQACGQPAGITATPADIARYEHLEERNFWQDVDLPNGDRVTMPGFAFRVDGDGVALHSPPALGQDDEEVYDAVGYDPETLTSTNYTATGATRGSQSPSPPDGSGDEKPLAGVKVADFTWYGAGPHGGKLLACLGADVVKVESKQKIDALRRSFQYDFDSESPNVSAYFNEVNLGKRSLRLNLTTEEGVDVAKDLIEEADVLMENFSPGFMGRIGLEYEDVKDLNPELVYLSMPGLGKEGPFKSHRSLGITIQSMAGLDHISGFPGDPPTTPGQAWPDPVAGSMGAVAVALGLLHREAHGEGVYVELPQLETSITFVHKALSSYLMNETLPERVGNRDEDRLYVQGAYPCAGEDEWAVVAIRDDAQWERLCRVMGRPALAADPRFRSQYLRLQHHDELDEIIESWTEERSPEEVRTRLQTRDVPAGKVADERDLVEFDPQLRARGYLNEVDHPEVGERTHTGLPMRMSGSSLGPARPAPRFGEHTAEVLEEWLGMDPAEISRARDAEILW